MLDDAFDPRERIRLDTRASTALIRSSTALRCLSSSLCHSSFWPTNMDGDGEKKRRAREKSNQNPVLALLSICTKPEKFALFGLRMDIPSRLSCSYPPVDPSRGGTTEHWSESHGATTRACRLVSVRFPALSSPEAEGVQATRRLAFHLTHAVALQARKECAQESRDFASMAASPAGPHCG